MPIHAKSILFIKVRISNPLYFCASYGVISTPPQKANPLDLHCVWREAQSYPLSLREVQDKRPFSFLVVIGPNGPDDFSLSNSSTKIKLSHTRNFWIRRWLWQESSFPSLMSKKKEPIFLYFLHSYHKVSLFCLQGEPGVSVACDLWHCTHQRPQQSLQQRQIWTAILYWRDCEPEQTKGQRPVYCVLAAKGRLLKPKGSFGASNVRGLNGRRQVSRNLLTTGRAAAPRSSTSLALLKYMHCCFSPVRFWPCPMNSHKGRTVPALSPRALHIVGIRTFAESVLPCSRGPGSVFAVPGGTWARSPSHPG